VENTLGRGKKYLNPTQNVKIFFSLKYVEKISLADKGKSRFCPAHALKINQCILPL
jgi:hypothetical protein